MSVTLRVRPGMTHGVKELQGGETLTVGEEEAALLLSTFGDKLEKVSEPDSPDLDVDEETPEGAGVAKTSARLRRRKPEDM